MPKLIGTPAIDPSNAFSGGRTVDAWAFNPSTNRMREIVDAGVAVGNDNASVPARTGVSTTFGTFAGDYATNIAFTPSGGEKFVALFLADAKVSTAGGANSVTFAQGTTWTFLRSFNTGNWQYEIDPSDGTGFGAQIAANEGDHLLLGMVVDDAGTNFGYSVFMESSTGATDSDPTGANAGETLGPTVNLYRQFNSPLCAMAFYISLDEVPTKAEYDALFLDPMSVFGTSPTLQTATRTSDTVITIAWNVATTATEGDYIVRDQLGGSQYLSSLYTLSGSGTASHTLTINSGTWADVPSIQVAVDTMTNDYGRGNNAYAEASVDVMAPATPGEGRSRDRSRTR